MCPKLRSLERLMLQWTNQGLQLVDLSVKQICFKGRPKKEDQPLFPYESNTFHKKWLDGNGWKFFSPFLLFFGRTTVLATIDYAILGLPLLQTTSSFHGKISRESTLSIARIRISPASAGSAPPRGDSAPVVLSPDRPAWPQWTSKPGGRNKNRKTSENGSVDTPFWEDATSKKKNCHNHRWLKKNHCLVFGIFAHSLPGKELWLYSWVLSSPQASKQHETLAKAPWIYQHGTICALGHQRMQRGHFWVQKVLVDVGCTVPDQHKWEIRKNTVCG